MALRYAGRFWVNLMVSGSVSGLVEWSLFLADIRIAGVPHGQMRWALLVCSLLVAALLVFAIPAVTAAGAPRDLRIFRDRYGMRAAWKGRFVGLFIGLASIGVVLT